MKYCSYQFLINPPKINLVIAIGVLVSFSAPSEAAPKHLAQAMREIAKDIIESQAPQGANVAVLPFQNPRGEVTELGQTLAGYLTDEIVKSRRFTALDRNYVSMMLNELKLNTVGVTDQKTALKLGKFTGARYLLVGLLEPYDKTRLIIQARLIETETGVLIAVSRAELGVDAATQELYSKKSEIVPASTEITPGKSSGGGPTKIEPNEADEFQLSSITKNGEPWELAEDYHADYRINTSTAEDAQEAARFVWPFYELFGDGKDRKKNKAAVDALDKFLEKYPDVADGYFLRAAISFHALHRKSYSNILADVDAAIKLRPLEKYGSRLNSIGQMYGMRAKLDIAMGNWQQAVTDLEKAVNLNPSEAEHALETLGINAGLWTKKDFGDLIAHFPSDDRVYLFRGLFYQSQSLVSRNQQEHSLGMNDYKKALSLNPRSGLCYYLMGRSYLEEAIWPKKLTAECGDQCQGDRLTVPAVHAFDKAIELNPKFLAAYKERADIHYRWKKYKRAIEDYDKIIELDPADGSAYSARGSAKAYLGNYYGAISDFGEAITKKADSSPSVLYKDRADAYMKTANFSAAIADINKAIQGLLGSYVIIMDVSQIKAIYPEGGSVPDETLARGIWRRFYPQMKYEDFSKEFLGNKGRFMPVAFLPELYGARGDAYLKLGHYRKAVGEYNRVVKGFPGSYADVLDRWRSLSKNSEGEDFIDFKTIDWAQDNTVRFWVKNDYYESVHDDLLGGPFPHDVINYAVNCQSKMIDEIETTKYNRGGDVVGTSGDGGWRRVIPETLGESLYNGMCDGSIK